MGNSLYYGDNLSILRESIQSESVDLIYLDPPFNSQANYNVLFKGASGNSADAQIEAFKDTWHWGEEAESAFSEVLGSANTQAAELLRALRLFLGENDVMAYLAMMAVRLLELHRVLKPTGSLYLHCDPTAGHYLKILLDAVFGARNYKNEIIWCYRKWSVAAGQFVRNHDDIHLVTKLPKGATFNVLYTDPSKGTMKRWKGHKQQADMEDGIRKASSLADEKAQSPMPDWWEISIINPNAAERLGYPTQKPLALLERIISASSNEGDVVLDPFCGCGTTVHAAHKLNRQWIGIDITHLAISLIERRLKDAFPGIAFDVYGTPQDLASAQDLARRDKYQFQWWAVSLVEARPYGGKKKGADGGIDGILFFRSGKDKTEKALVSVKGGENIGVGMIRDLIAVVEREKAAVGVLISLAFPTKPMEKEAAAAGFFETPFEKVPRIQIITLAELFQGKRPRIPRIDSAATFNAAAREKTDRQTEMF
ncbi:MAG: DNA methylase [Rhodospirillales bacterium RIFCSPLOWO2_12_FULL_58_28]|nr:MAG: DNA methylase [Rhodospirillales bacterium RIFCSPLOWO2_02_FULL_58_16]OHC78002.1 MAG: DNA methylase [Rhodospirillales bacterium RIFCSPLOWO2_12_FULL_58_28]